MRNVDKKYIYLREKKKCFHCGRELISLGKVTLDHYFPRSMGGTYDLFNLVCSCRKCNKYKKSMVPEDYKDIQIKLFIRAVEDKKLICYPSINIKHDEMVRIVGEINDVEAFNDYTIFKSYCYKLYVKENKIFKLEKKC